jgi:hypothetical protein
MNYNKNKLDFYSKICYYILYYILGATLVAPIILMGLVLKTNPLKIKRVASPPIIYTKINNYCKDSYISKVLSESKYPYTLAAIAKAESDYRPQIVGDHGTAHGMYQIRPKHWGAVPDRIEDQTKKAEQILDHLIAKHGYKKAIYKWNGSGKEAKQYAKNVLIIRQQIIRGT